MNQPSRYYPNVKWGWHAKIMPQAQAVDVHDIMARSSILILEVIQAKKPGLTSFENAPFWVKNQCNFLLASRLSAAYVALTNVMKALRLIQIIFLADWKPTILIALPVFTVTMWYGVSRNFPDMGLFTFAMALASWHLAGTAVLAYRKIAEWRASRGRLRG